MRLLVDATALLDRGAGISRLVGELVDRTAARLTGDESLVLAARVVRRGPADTAALAARARLPRTRVVRLVVPERLAAGDGRVLGWSELDLRCGAVDVAHGPDFSLPAVRGARRVVMIHDLLFLTHAEGLPAAFVAAMEAKVRHAAAHAAAVVVVSETTARDVVSILGVPRERIVVAHPGVSEEFFDAGDPDDDRRELAACGVAPPYVLCPAATHPRKNHVRLLEAFAAIRRRGLPHRLVLTGAAGFAHGAVAEAETRLGLGDAVVRAGVVSDAALRALTRRADAVALPSLGEGFGLPVLEGLAAGRPVLTSAGGGTQEAAGDAAVLVDPTSVDAIAAGLERALTDAALRARLGVVGPERARRFTWDTFAERHLELWRGLARRGAEVR